MDVRVNERNPAVRVPPLTALTVFALMAGLCAAIVFVVMGELQPQILGSSPALRSSRGYSGC